MIRGLIKSFKDFFRSFKKKGLRFDQRFFKQTFFGGRGGFLGGVVFWGLFKCGRTVLPGILRSPAVGAAIAPLALKAVQGAGKIFGGLLLGKTKDSAENNGTDLFHPLDVRYHLSLSDDDLKQGKWVTVAIGCGQERVSVKIKVPPGANRGMRLKVKGTRSHC